MKLHIQPPDDNAVHIYCVDCQQEAVTTVEGDVYSCTACGKTNPRAIIIDPQVKWRVGPTGEYEHETAGVIVVDSDNRMLLFDRTRFPFGLTFPAGHIDKDESPRAAARRELHEETGLVVDAHELKHVASDPLPGDSCRRGSDMHVWHSFIVRKPAGQIITIDSTEGANMTWMTPVEASRNNLTPATREVLTRHWRKFDGLLL